MSTIKFVSLVCLHRQQSRSQVIGEERQWCILKALAYCYHRHKVAARAGDIAGERRLGELLRRGGAGQLQKCSRMCFESDYVCPHLELLLTIWRHRSAMMHNRQQCERVISYRNNLVLQGFLLDLHQFPSLYMRLQVRFLSFTAYFNLLGCYHIEIMSSYQFHQSHCFF